MQKYQVLGEFFDVEFQTDSNLILRIKKLGSLQPILEPNAPWNPLGVDVPGGGGSGAVCLLLPAHVAGPSAQQLHHGFVIAPDSVGFGCLSVESPHVEPPGVDLPTLLKQFGLYTFSNITDVYQMVVCH